MSHRMSKIASHVIHNPFSDVVIVSFARTPIGYFGGALSSLSAADLGGVVIKGALARTMDKVAPSDVEEVIMGHVLSAGCGQAPARQAAMKGGLPVTTVCSSVNKVCASGLKALTIGACHIALKQRSCMIVGGMESMSNVPFYSPSTRFGNKLGHSQLTDGLIQDGLWDVYTSQHMGSCADLTAKKFNLTRENQDAYAKLSIERANASKAMHAKAIVPIDLPRGRVDSDEQISRAIPDKLPRLKAVFTADGTVTAGNGSSLSDGAAALVLMSRDEAMKRGLKPIASIISFADAERDSVEFTIAPSEAVQMALDKAHITTKDVDLWEMNEAFAAVILANQELLGLDGSNVNIHGGAIALGHPLGCSGARIVCTLLTALKAGGVGCAAICNGGGGATALIIRKEC
jgi:acetyl-CoA C-acetyltransferase